MNREDYLFFTEARTVASALLALTVKEMFPRLTVGEGQATAKGFYRDFLGFFPEEKQVLQEIEERMSAAIYQDLPILFKEMSAVSAREYFLFHQEQILSSQVALADSPTIPVLEIKGRLFPVAEEGSLESLRDLGFVKLYAVERIESGVRIHGASFSNKQHLKDFIKKESKALPKSHMEIGKMRGLFLDAVNGEKFFLPKGQKMISLLLDEVRKMFEREGALFISTSLVRKGFFHDKLLSSYQKILQNLGPFEKTISLHECVTICALDDKKSSFGFLDEASFFMHGSYAFCKKHLLVQEVISSLRFMTKIFTILGLECRIVLTGRPKMEVRSLFIEALQHLGTQVFEETKEKVACLELRVQDRIGLEWPVSCIYAPKKSSSGEIWALPVVWMHSVQRVLGLILERTFGEVPFWMAPVQVKVLPVQKRHFAYASDVAKQLALRGFRAQAEDCELKAGLFRATEEGVPCIAVVGDKEVEKEEVTVRLGKEQSLTFSLLEFGKWLESKLNRSDDSEL
jgi:threonyl-tRNA synthetase